MVEVAKHRSQASVIFSTDVNQVQELFLSRTLDGTHINGVQTVTRLHRVVEMGHTPYPEPMDIVIY